MHPDAKCYAAIWRLLRFPQHDFSLQLCRGVQGVCWALEDRKEAVARMLHYLAAGGQDAGIYDFDAKSAIPSMDLKFVGFHQAGIADHIGRQYRPADPSELIDR